MIPEDGDQLPIAKKDLKIWPVIIEWKEGTLS